MLLVMTDEHAKLQKKLKIVTDRSQHSNHSFLSSSLKRNMRNKSKGADRNKQKSSSNSSNDNKIIIKDLQTKNVVLNDEIKRLRAKLISMKQRTNKTDAAAVVRRTPGKLSIAERMKLRRREKEKLQKQKR